VELRHLRYFLAIADAGSMTAAAERLRIAQPSLSRQVRDLERAVGRELLERSASGVRLTGAGRALYEQARRFVELEASTRALVRRAGEVDDVVTVGLAPGLSHPDLARIVATVRRAVSRARLEFEQHSSVEQLRLLSRRGIDLGFLHEPPPSQTRSHFLGSRPIGVAIRPGHRLHGRTTVAVDQLGVLVVLVHSRSQAPAVTDQLVARLEAAGVALEWQFASFYDYATVWAAAVDADAVAITQAAALQGLPGWSWAVIDGVDVQLSTWLAWPPDARQAVRDVAAAVGRETFGPEGRPSL